METESLLLFLFSLYLLLGVDEISLCVGEKCNSKTPLGNLHDLPLFYTFEKILLYRLSRKLVHFEKKVMVGTNPYPQEEKEVDPRTR